MAKNYWISRDGNWDAGSSWSLGSKPANTNEVIFNGLSSNKSVLTGHTDESGVDLESLTTQDNYSGDIGYSGSSGRLAIGVETKVVHRGSGTLYANFSDPNSDDLRIIIDSPNLVKAFEFGGSAQAYLHVFGGRVHVTTEATGPSLFLRLTPVRGREAFVLADSSAANDTWASVIQTGGTLDNARRVLSGAVYDIEGGVCTQRRTAATINVGGILRLDPIATTSGAIITNINVLPGGLFDATTADLVATVVNLTLFPGSGYEPGPDVIVTNLYDLRKRVPDF